MEFLKTVISNLVRQKQKHYKMNLDKEANYADIQRDALKEEHLRPTRKRKDDTTTIHYVRCGHRYMNRAEHQDAHRTYTEALCSVVPNSNLAALCFFYRAKCLFRMNLFNECLTDVKYAMNIPVAEDVKNRLICMRNQVLCQKLMQQIGRRPGGRRIRRNNAVSTASETIELSYGENPKIPGMSDALTMIHDDVRGHCIVAVKPIKMGDVLLVQSPYTVVIQEDKRFCFCHYCLKPSWNLLPCDYCDRALYCSKECDEKAAKQYHKFECALIYEDGRIAGPLRLFLVGTDRSNCFYQRLRELHETFSAKNSATYGYIDGMYKPDAITSSLYTVPYIKLVPTEALRITATLILDTLKYYSNCLDGYELENATEFLHVFVYAYTANMALIRGASIADALAQAIYPVFNILHHECYNNTLWYTANYRDRVLLACRDILPGEIITNNYIGQNILKESDDRSHYLQTMKQWTCTCIVCSEEYTFKQELGKIKLPASLQSQLRNNPIDLKSMWEVLEALNVEANGKPCLEIAAMRFCIMDAYLNSQHPLLKNLYQNLGII